MPAAERWRLLQLDDARFGGLARLVFTFVKAAIFGHCFDSLFGSHTVEHEHAVQVIELVLKEPRQKLVGLDCDLFSGKVDSLQQNLFGSNHLDVQARNREAPFFVDPFTGCFDDFGIDQNVGAVTNVVDEQLLLHTDLRSRKAYAGSVVHDVEHLVGETNEFVVDFLDLERSRLQHGIAVCSDFVRHGARLSTVNSGDSAHYFDVDNDDLERLGSSPKRVQWKAFGAEFTAMSDRGVFSYGHLDKGTAVLFDLAPRPPDCGVFLDIGCGWGAITLTLAKLAPRARIHAIDVNPRAIDLTASNANDAGLDNVHVSNPAQVHPGLKFDLIWSNPPIRIGKEALHVLLANWLARLTPEGSAYMVVQKNLGSDSLADWLDSLGYAVERIGSRKGFRVLRIVQRQ